MSAIDDLPPLREVIREHALSARKSLGQNFLLDLNLTARIARAAGPLEDATIVEIGPGPGGLTRALLALGASRVIAVEHDARALPALEAISRRYPGRLDVVHADAQAFDPRPLLGGARAKIVANLPYNIATALLIGWPSVSSRRKMTKPTGGSACLRTGALRPRSCSTFRPRLSCPNPRSPRRWCGLCHAPRRSLAIAGLWSKSRQQRSASGGKCCGKASNHYRRSQPGWR